MRNSFSRAGYTRRGALALLLSTMLIASASAQHHLLVGVDSPSEAIWAVDTHTNAVVPVVTGIGANAMAVDEANTTVYIMPNTVTLYRWNYSTPLTPPVLIGTTQASGSTISLTGLAFDAAAGKLYASRDLASGPNPEGFYEINTATAQGTLVFATPASYRWGGFDYNPVNNKFYVASDEGAIGLHEVNPAAQTLSFIAPYPAGAIDLDGMAVGDGRVFMVEDRAVQVGGKIHVFNLATLQYEAPLQTPWFFNEVFSGATYVPSLGSFIAQIPEPATAGGFAAIIALFSLRRRRWRSATAPCVVAATFLVGIGAVGTGAAQAQLVMASGTLNQGMYVGNLGTLRQTNQFPLPVNIIDWSNVPVGRNIRGMAADDANRRIYWLDLNSPSGVGLPTSTLYRMSYDTLVPELVGIVRNASSGLDQSFMGLALDTANQKMYATYNIGGTPGEGIYEIDYLHPSGGGTPAVFATPRLLYNTLPGGESAYTFQNLDYDPVTSKVYGINDDTDQLGRGLYSFDLVNGSVAKIVSSPDYRRIENDFDGLATGGGKAYWTTDEPGFVYVYDLLANPGTFTDFLSPILTEDGLFGGAAYAPGLIPEPASLSIVVLAIAAGLRRRPMA